MELAFPGTNINILKWIKYVLLVGNDEIIGEKKKKWNITGLFQVQNYLFYIVDKKKLN